MLLNVLNDTMNSKWLRSIPAFVGFIDRVSNKHTEIDRYQHQTLDTKTSYQIAIVHLTMLDDLLDRLHLRILTQILGVVDVDEWWLAGLFIGMQGIDKEYFGSYPFLSSQAIRTINNRAHVHWNCQFR